MIPVAPASAEHGADVAAEDRKKGSDPFFWSGLEFPRVSMDQVSLTYACPLRQIRLPTPPPNPAS